MPGGNPKPSPHARPRSASLGSEVCHPGGPRHPAGHDPRVPNSPGPLLCLLPPLLCPPRPFSVPCPPPPSPVPHLRPPLRPGSVPRRTATLLWPWWLAVPLGTPQGVTAGDGRCQESQGTWGYGGGRTLTPPPAGQAICTPPHPLPGGAAPRGIPGTPKSCIPEGRALPPPPSIPGLTPPAPSFLPPQKTLGRTHRRAAEPGGPVGRRNGARPPVTAPPPRKGPAEPNGAGPGPGGGSAAPSAGTAAPTGRTAPGTAPSAGDPGDRGGAGGGGQEERDGGGSGGDAPRSHAASLPRGVPLAPRSIGPARRRGPACAAADPCVWPGNLSQPCRNPVATL